MKFIHIFPILLILNGALSFRENLKSFEKNYKSKNSEEVLIDLINQSNPQAKPKIGTDPNVSQDTYNSNVVVKLNEFYKMTPQEYQNLVLSSVLLLIGGIILFFLSVQLTYWNEKKAVRHTELLDNFGEKNCYYIENGKEIKIDDNIKNNLFIINGKIYSFRQTISPKRSQIYKSES
jgi:hypothetical protein